MIKENIMTEYNPADGNVDDVKAYVDANPTEAQAVLDAEEARGADARSTLVKHLQSVVESQADQSEAPVAAEPKAVTVAPVDQSELQTRSFHDKEYEVSPDRGHRLKG